MQNDLMNISVIGRVETCINLLRSQNLKGKVIVDIGSSVGWLEKNIANLGAKKIIGIEPDPKSLEMAKREVKNALFIKGEAGNVPLRSNFADIVTIFDVIEHVAKDTEQKIFLEIKRILKKGGILLLSTPHDHPLINFLDLAWYFGHRHYSVRTIKKFLKFAGFKIIDLKIRGNVLSSIYLAWLYIATKIFGQNPPGMNFFSKFEDLGYKNGRIGTIYLVAKVKK